MRARFGVGMSLLLLGCGKRGASLGDVPSAATSRPVAELAARSFPLPAGTGPSSFDYIVCDRKNGKVWIPMARDEGSVEVFDVAQGAFTHLTGFPVEVRDNGGQKRSAGPSAAALGDGVVYVGNRSNSEICAFDAATLRRSACLRLPTSADGLQHVASAKELWVTAPRENVLVVLDATRPDALAAKLTISVDGQPEGFAADEERGIFYTNLEDKDRTLAIDVKTHAVLATWAPGCGSAGPRGLAFDSARRLLVVACTDHLQVLDAGRDGALLGRLDTGGGSDNLDYLASERWVYAASGKDGRLSVTRLEPDGRLVPVATGATAARARNPVADAKGNAYVVDPAVPRLLVLDRAASADR